MRIVYTGKIPESVVYEGSCWSCKTRIECDQHETESITSPYGDTNYFYACPICKKSISLSPKREMSADDYYLK